MKTHDSNKLNRDIVRDTILRHPDGKRLNDYHLNKAVELGVIIWSGQTTVGVASEIAVKSVIGAFRIE